MVDVAQCRDCNLTKELEDLRQQRDVLLAKVQEYEREVIELRKRVSGRTTERRKNRSSRPRPPARPPNDEEAQKQRKRNRELRRQLPAEPVNHPLPPERQGRCPACEKADMEPMPPECAEQWEYIPGRIVRRQHRRAKVRCPVCHHFETAEAPARVVEGGLYGPGLVAQTIVSKCADCIPLYRQSKAYLREGVPLARSTLVNLFHRAAELLRPLHSRLASLIALAWVVYADETPLKIQGADKTSYIWTFACELAIVYCFSADRSGETPKKILGDSPGLLVVDGYTGYNQVTIPGRRLRGGCNSHARRKFIDVEDEDVDFILDQFQEVFAVEREAKRLAYTDEELLQLRRERSAPAMEKIKARCEQAKGRCPPGSPMGKAITYITNQWGPLTLFLEHAEIAPDNNLSERLLRIIALGRKNYLFVGHEDAGFNTAVLCTLVVTCELHGVNPLDYLTDVLIRIQTHPQSDIDSLLPHQWKERFGPKARA